MGTSLLTLPYPGYAAVLAALKRLRGRSFNLIQTAVASGLAWYVAHDVVGHGRRKAQQHLGAGDVGADVVVVADDVDGQLRKPLQQHGFVTGPHRFLDFGEDEKICHGGLV